VATGSLPNSEDLITACLPED